MAALWWLISVAPAGAQDQRLTWNDEWREVTRGEAIAALSLATTSSLARLFWHPSEGRVFDGPFQRLDDRARLTLPTLGGRRAARFSSDALLWTLVLQANVIDPGLVVWVGDDNRDLALDLYTINMLSFAVTTSALVLLRNIVRRERPYAAGCRDGSPTQRDCRNAERFRSFPSPHTAIAFTTAALTCSHHAHLGIYSRHRAVSATVCGGALATATLVGLLRLLADRHYLTDVLFGAVLGVLSGYVLPAALHYGFRRN